MSVWQDYPFEDAVAVLFDFGDVSRDLLASKNSVTDLGQTWEKLRIRLVVCDIEEMLRKHAADPSEVEALAREWEQGAQHVAPSAHGPVRENVRFFLAARKVLQAENARAAAINCHAMPEHDLRLPCTAMVQLHREGILAACEMDLNGLLSSMLLSHLAEHPAFMGNVIARSEETFDIEHCVAPPNMLPELEGYDFEDYHGKSEHATAAVTLPDQGPVTLARISPDLERAHFAVGEIASAHHKGVCRNSLTIRVTDCGTFLDEKLDGHYAVVCGDLSAELSRRGIPEARL